MHKVVEELRSLIAENNWEDKFDVAIRKAGSYNIPQLRHIKTLEDYLTWMDNLLQWQPIENYLGREIYNRICEFYFILNQEPVRGLQNRVIPAQQSAPLTPLSQWIVAFADAWGEYLDTPESISDASILTFYASPPFNMDEYMPPPSGYRTFNQMFARHVKPGMRPIAAIGDPKVITAAADSTLVGWWQINEHSKIRVKALEWSIMELLDGSPYKERFKGGVFMHSFLNTTDYHRLHVPVPGTVLESRVVLGQAYLDVQAVPITGNTAGEFRVAAVRTFDAQDGTGYQFAQARGLLVMDSPIGLVAVLPIGMAQVSSVVMTAEVGRTLHKGEEFSYFQFGGSDHVILFEAKSNVTIVAQPNVHYNMGQTIALAYPSL
ncbi:phosphatidylserine decarboxylase [Pararhodospirillum photometricum]|uniref:Phosphatidylserine decarboxylase n=1 Tax=Pararhodospirillum photometricum DSM 122 TaxID=1150469 RepID=H6SK07_PARPM|nr:phosphatidylserine decarboxylase [Pararhodospirillum photometricum]CCG08322.1 Phosphatidylserine decarboxylase [Pararhodospirillum photometricum DSM 122]